MAFLGIILATVLGFFVGILRLSDNWLVSRMAYGYVEFTRNTPVLLLILPWHGIIINTLPHPLQSIAIGDATFLTNRGFHVPRPLLDSGFEWVALALVAALAGAFLVRRHAAAFAGASSPWTRARSRRRNPWGTRADASRVW